MAAASVPFLNMEFALRANSTLGNHEPARMKAPEILYQDDTCFVVNKPAGLAVQGGAGVGTSLDVLLKNGFGGTGSGDALLVHRLDKETSGVLLVARGRENAAWYSRQIAGHGARKEYLAVCAAGNGGRALKTAGCIDRPLTVQGREKSARTKYRVIGRGVLPGGDGFAVFHLELETGRLHQIRRHLSMIGHPVLGDDKYGNFALNKHLHKTCGLRALLLHAESLTFETPDGQRHTVHAPPPQTFTPWLSLMEPLIK
jgi:23S rRNA pseudouridine955/2504/2580 synthase